MISDILLYEIDSPWWLYLAVIGLWYYIGRRDGQRVGFVKAIDMQRERMAPFRWQCTHPGCGEGFGSTDPQWVDQQALDHQRKHAS